MSQSFFSQPGFFFFKLFFVWGGGGGGGILFCFVLIFVVAILFVCFFVCLFVCLFFFYLTGYFLCGWFDSGPRRFLAATQPHPDVQSYLIVLRTITTPDPT